jgi:hypothetical protein
VDPIAALADAGFDLAHVFDAGAAAREPGLELLAGASRGVLIGNTRALWPTFVAAMRDPVLAAKPDPLEHYTERAIEAAYPGARIIYGHRTYGDGFFPLQRLAVATGLGGLSDGGLVIHPTYGPWFALRAVVLTDGEPVVRHPIPKPCVCDGRCQAALTTALATRGPDGWKAWLAVRESCTIAEFRYSDAQIRYHYTKAWGVDVE